MEQAVSDAVITQIRQSPDAVQALIRFLRSFCGLNPNFTFYPVERSEEITSALWSNLLPCIELYLTEALQRQHRVSFEFASQGFQYGAFGLKTPPGLDEFLCFFRPEEASASYSLITLSLEAQGYFGSALKCPVVVAADGYVTFGAELLWVRPIS